MPDTKIFVDGACVDRSVTKELLDEVPGIVAEEMSCWVWGWKWPFITYQLLNPENVDVTIFWGGGGYDESIDVFSNTQIIVEVATYNFPRPEAQPQQAYHPYRPAHQGRGRQSSGRGLHGHDHVHPHQERILGESLADRKEQAMEWHTKKKLRDKAAIGLVIAETAILMRMARKSNGTLRRACRNATLGASAGAMVGGGLGFADSKFNHAYNHDTLGATTESSEFGALATGLVAGIASLVWDAFRSRKRRWS